MFRSGRLPSSCTDPVARSRAAVLPRIRSAAALAALVLFSAACDGQSPLADDPLLPPGVPGLVAPVNGAGDVENAVELRWSAGAPGTIYEIVVARDESFADLVIGVSDLQSPTFVLTGLEVGHAYCWRVRARNAVGTSSWSAEWTFTPAREVHIADVPFPVWPPHDMINLPEQVTVQWTAVDGALSYDLQVAQEDIFVRRDADMTGIPEPSKALVGLVKGYEYFWRIRSRNHAGVSAWSPVWRFVITNPDNFDGPL